MKLKNRSIKIIIGVFLLTHASVVISEVSLLPIPQEIKQSPGFLTLTSRTSLGSGPNVPSELTTFCAQLLRDATGWKVPVSTKGTIQFSINTREEIPDEGYRLLVNSTNIQIVASTRKGLFYGFQTLRQLMPAVAFGRGLNSTTKWEVPFVEINDAPRFSWRGVLVDVSRKFQKPETIKKLLDAMAACKLNIFHWHLTDDQGWRIEIKKYPKLTALSKSFYTQEEIREIVAYALARNITIVPEIDVPGHSRAACTAYPQLACRNAKGKKNKRSRTYCPSDPYTYSFLENVLAEVADLFPGPWIHIGGDEVGTGAWRKCPDCQALMKKEKLRSPRNLEAFFIKKLVRYCKKLGKTPITWDEAFHADIDPSQMIMSWRGVLPGMKAAKAGHKVILCPVSSLYFDRINSRSKNQNRGYSNNPVFLHFPYFFEPRSPLLQPQFQKNILGAQGNIWGEKIKNDSHLLKQSMLRGCALAEATWSRPENKNWPSFVTRVAQHAKRLDAMQVAYFWEPESTAIERARFTEKEIDQRKPLTLDISKTVQSNTLYEFTFHRYFGKATFKAVRVELLENGKIIDSDTRNHVVTNDPRRPNQLFQVWVKNYKPKATYTLRYYLEKVGEGSVCGTLLEIPPLPKNMYSKWASPESVYKARKKK